MAKSGRVLLEDIRERVDSGINTFMAKAEPAPQPSVRIRPAVCVRIGVKYLREQLHRFTLLGNQGLVDFCVSLHA